MLTVYPSNRLEDLAQLLQAVLSYRKSAVLKADKILVESKGMQHWLNLQLAQSQGISMNLQFQMPSSFLWELARSLLSTDKIPYQSSYRREILAWRIDRLMASHHFLNNDLCTEASHYWHGQSPDRLKRFQLARSVADLFEQYMLFRADWLILWAQGRTHFTTDHPALKSELWQAWLWRQLIADIPYHPINLQQMTIQALAYPKKKLPEQVLIFAINTLAPQTLAFFDALSDYCQIHLFHLNPCVQFWGGIQSDKVMARQIREQQVSAWIDDEDEDEQYNPLLANLGQQGKEFFNALQNVNSFEISAFDQALADVENESPVPVRHNVLALLQNDILSLYDRTNNTVKPSLQSDDSLIISSSHSALREIQCLHDQLLYWFDQDAELKPRDVVVMCPMIEDYAPYIDAVFRRPWDKTTSNVPRLPCSIADRTLLDSEPLVAAFMEFMQLPDSRFEISKILDYLRLPALQKKFGFINDELETIEWWLKEAAIHWGRDQAHKQKLLDNNEVSPMFTWEWGLTRLLLGYASGNEQSIYIDAKQQSQLLLPHVEGQDALLLGRLLQLLERLKQHTSALLKARTPIQWQRYLLLLCENFFTFSKAEQNESILIEEAINALADNTGLAKYDNKIELAVVRNYLQHYFSQPDSGNHFLTGQITFCSMVPMRSIPFKVIAILGLNDGKFPRQNIPMGFDLISKESRRSGDRTRRGDDRYLFLEALISARQHLYLSYQGRDIRKNNVVQPSLILKELMSYLQQGFGWHWVTDDDSPSSIQHQAMHPFSRANYQTEKPSYDSRWLRVCEKGLGRENQIKLNRDPVLDEIIPLETLITFFHNPLKVFAQQRLHLDLGSLNNRMINTEPFSVNALSEYQIRDKICQVLLNQDNINKLLQEYRHSGILPDSPITTEYLNQWQEEATYFSQQILKIGTLNKVIAEIDIAEFRLKSSLFFTQDQLILWRPATCKAKDQIRMWLQHCLATCHLNRPIETLGIYLSKKRNKHITEKILLHPIEVDMANAELQKMLNHWQIGLTEPSLLHAELAKNLFDDQKNKALSDYLNDKQQPLTWIRTINGGYHQVGLIDDPYFRWFYPILPDLNLTRHETLFSCYQSLYQNIYKEK